ncbi:MAG: type II secretion system F family protein [Clostridiales bacterium]|nr:type II secretion system F family protein [Clostridiales bacterium]
MAEYSYVVVAQNGKERKGTMEANSEEAARAALKAQGNVVVSLGEASLLNKEIELPFGNGASAKALGLMCRQMESLIHAGVTIIDALRMMADQTENKNLKKALQIVRKDVEKGDSLADAMDNQSNIFPEILVNMVRAGEASGNLEVAFNRMSTHFEKNARIKGLIVQAMIYPIILLIVIIGVVVLMMVKIVPSFTQTFADANMELPGITKAVMAVSDFMSNYWLVMIGAIIAIVVACKLFQRTEQGALFFGRLMLKMPLFGKLIVKQASAQFSRTMSTLLAAGITLVDALEILSKIVSNYIIKGALKSARLDVEQGIPLSVPLEASGVFPPMVYQMSKIGEETGNLEGMLDRIADYFEEEVESATKSITAALEPLIIIIMACVVVPIVLAIMLPMLSMMSAADNV